MAQAKLELPIGASADQIALLQAIKSGQDENDAEISIVLNALNTGVAKLIAKNGKIITGLQGDVLKQLQQRLTENDNQIDHISTTILSWTQNQLDDIKLLLTQLTAQAGLVDPGDPLEAALIDKIAEAPEIAYSASLLLALRDWLPHFKDVVIVLREIRDRLPGSPVAYQGEEPSREKSESIENLQTGELIAVDDWEG